MLRAAYISGVCLVAFMGCAGYTWADTGERYIPNTKHYFVKDGDTLAKIASRHNVTLQVLQNYNALSADAKLIPGKIISIPSVIREPSAAKKPGKFSQPVLKSRTVPVPWGSIEIVELKPLEKPLPAPIPSNNSMPDKGRTIAKPKPVPATKIDAVEQTAQLDSVVKEILKTRYNPTGRDISLIVPLKERQFFLGDVTLFISKDDELTLRLNELTRHLEKLISDEAIASLAAGASAAGNISLKAITAAGFGITYDPGLLELNIIIPVTARQKRGLNIARLDREARGNFVEPEKFSAFLTMRGALDYLHSGPQSGFNDPFFDFFLGGRLDKVAFETEAFYDGFSGAFMRRGSRLIYDDVNRAIRYSAGDVRAVTRGFQSPADTLGLSINRAYSTLQPLQSIRPRGERSFVLNEPGFVEVMINGRPVRRLQLDAGTFDLSDFPFVSGSNDVRVVVENQAGRSEELAFNLFFDQTMLASGTSEFAATAGFAAPLRSGEPDYDFSAPQFTGFYRRGISDKLTLGGNLQVNEHVGLLGGEGIWSLPFGTMRTQAALSTISGVTDMALAFDFERQFVRNGSNDSISQKRSRFTLSLDYTGADFTRFGAVSASNPFILEAAGSFSWDINKLINATLSANYGMGRGTQKDIYGAEARIGWRIASRTGLNFSLRYDDNNSFEGVGAFVTLSHRLGQRSNVRASYDTRNDRGVLSYTRSGNRNRGDWGFNADLERARDDTAFNADLNYLSNRAELGMAHRAAIDENGQVIDQRTSLRAATTLGFAGGSFAFGRPGGSNFAIIAPHKTLRGKQVTINPQDGSDFTRSGALGPALTTEIGSYSKSTVRYDVEELPIGYDLGEGNFDLLAPLHAGYKLTVGSNYSISVVGTLFNEFDEPVRFITGTATREGGGEGQKSIRIFTNGAGRFGEAFTPGRWVIIMKDELQSRYEFTIPDTASGIFKAGKLEPMGGGK